MKDLLGVLAIACVLVCAGFATYNQHSPSLQMQVAGVDTPLYVSIPNLISDPATYDGKLVAVVGIARFEHESSALYLNRRDLEEGKMELAIWLDGLWPIPKQWADLTDHFVTVEGVFDASKRGYLRVFAGGLREIKKIDENRYFPK